MYECSILLAVLVVSVNLWAKYALDSKVMRQAISYTTGANHLRTFL